MKLIGITGLARSGKDSIADHLVDMHEYVSYSFAKPMKDACKIIFNWTDEHVYGHLKDVIDPVFNVSPRIALQTMGTEWGRETINQSIWLIRAQIEIEKHDLLVIPDVRFDNEAELIRRHGGRIIQVTRRQAESVNTHSSEAGINQDFVDYRLRNEGSLSQLYNMVDVLFDEL